jgi:hypothetical protein
MLSDNNSDAGLCVILYVAKISQNPNKVLTKAGFNNLIHEMIENNQDWSFLKQLLKEIIRLMLALSEKMHLSVV